MPPTKQADPRRASLVRDIVDEARRLYDPAETNYWPHYSRLKNRIAEIYEPGSYAFDDAVREMLDALETGE
jgi:hypothetical protein